MATGHVSKNALSVELCCRPESPDETKWESLAVDWEVNFS